MPYVMQGIKSHKWGDYVRTRRGSHSADDHLDLLIARIDRILER